MALNAYDPLKHHIGLGATGSEKGFTVVGAYTKDLQRELGGAADFGGSFDLLGQAPGRSRWTQDDFTGGSFQYRFEKDAAMFAECKNFIPAQQSRSLVSVPPVKFKKHFDVAGQSNPGSRQTDIPKAMFAIAGSIFTVFEHGILRYITGTDTNQWGNWLIDTHHWYAGAAYDLNEQIIYVLLDTDTGTDAPVLLRISPTSLDTTPYAIGSFDPMTPLPHTIGKTGTGLQVNDGSIVVGIGLRLYTFAPPSDVTDVLELPTITEIGRLPGYWIDSVAYNGMTYILCGAVDGMCYVVAFDGTAVSPIVQMPFNFRGKCMCVYGGRLYLGGSGTDIDGGDRYGELYEITGASVRLVRTFAPESYQSAVSYPQNIWDLVVDEGLLWFSQKGNRMMAYDLTSDGFFGGSEIQQSGLILFKHAVGRERVWSWGTKLTDHSKDGIYRIGINGDTVSAHSAELITSDFIPEPAVTKVWSDLVVQTRYDTVDTFQYSTDQGTTWTTVAAASTTNEGDMHYSRYVLSGLTPSRHIRFRFQINRPTTVDNTFVELLAFTLSFAFANTGKHGWTIAVNGAESVEGRDGTTVDQDIALMATTLWGYAENATIVSFIDLDQTVHKVKVEHITEQQPVIGPQIGANATTGIGGRPEAYFSLTLVEV